MCFSGDKEEHHGKSQASFTDISYSSFRCSMLSPWMDKRWTFILLVASVSRIESTSRTLERKLVTSQSYTFGPGLPRNVTDPQQIEEVEWCQGSLPKIERKHTEFELLYCILMCLDTSYCSGQGRNHISMDVSNPSDNRNPFNLESIAVDIPDGHWYCWLD